MTAKLCPLTDFLAFTLANTSVPNTLGYADFSAEFIARGIVQLTPKQPSSTDIVLSCGIHGNETAPIELCNQLLAEIARGELQLRQRLLLILGNPEAMLAETRFVDENLNRLFCGTHQIGPCNIERQRAAIIETAVAGFFADATRARIHWDLHTAIRGSEHEKFAVCPYQPERGYRQQTLALLAEASIEAFLFNHAAAHTFSYHSAHLFNADAFTVELGKVAPFGANDLTKLEKMACVLRKLIAAESINVGAERLAKTAFYQVRRVINKDHDSFRFSFSDDTANFTRFKQGDLIASSEQQSIFCDTAIEAIVFPNAKVPVGQRAALCVVPVPLAQVCM
ncbi:succinylglutamate desuccinylase [Shewanella avicenniae]|uniref:Succinylglutamate desuccinylase n=1 Tax=Shewanella avicenniae TaxID=2814294 RepID=A0ABX7QMK6_9GAMM|nr:succinylglutamate desuccinylase [Shewanella avicenniae]QSX32000.1 succinylglutamate desuccinylase [Shewanella avicenniae]